MNLQRHLALLALLPLVACTMGSSIMNGKATIVPPAVDAAAVPALDAGAPFAVVAGDARDAWFVLSPDDSGRTQANLKVWSDEAAAAFARDAAALGANVDPSAERRVEVTVTRVTAEVGFSGRVTVTMTVRTGDGAAATFERSTSSLRGPVFCSEDAMRQAIEAALQDGRVRAFLES